MEQKYLAFDIGGTFVKYGVLNRQGELLASGKHKTQENLENLLESMRTVILNERDSISGIAISCPGKIDTINGVVYNGGALTFLHEIKLKEMMESEFAIPCSICNDGKAAASAELWLGNLNGFKQGAAIILGTGVGGGILLDGKVIEGPHFQAGELSFILSELNKRFPDNVLGGRLSAVNLVRKIAKILGLESHDGVGVFEGIKLQHYQEVNKIFSEYCSEVAQLIINLQVILDLEKVVIGGGISEQAILIQEINRQYTKIRHSIEILETSFVSIPIEKCKYGSQANLVGATYQLLTALS